MITNRINQYLSEVSEPPPIMQPPAILQHADNISKLTIFNAGWSEGYTAGYDDCDKDNEVYQRIIYGSCILIGFAVGLVLGAVLL